MKTSCRIAATATLIGMAALSSGNGHAQQVSEVVGPIAKIVAEGYAFAGGSVLSAERQKVITAPNKTNYEVKYQLGFAYFTKGPDFLVCQYEIVIMNPIPDQYRLGKPESKCFRIR